MFNLRLGMITLGMLAMISCKTETPSPSAEFTVTIENAFEAKENSASGIFNTPVGATNPGPATPGSAYSFSFYAGKGSKLSFATMFVQSNDLFYAPAEEGIALYDANGTALSGDITSLVDLWDAGTEVNEEPGTGANQAPRQSDANTGADENATVELASNIADGFGYPADEAVIQVDLLAEDGGKFTLTINNISGSSSLPTPLAPGVWAVHNSGTPLFVEGQATTNGLEALAEDGNAADLGTYLADRSGYVSPFAPGVWVVHKAGLRPLFSDGEVDADYGLEALAEDGSPADLDTWLSSADDVLSNGVFNTPVSANDPGPIFPGQNYSFTFTAEDGDYLNLATMLVQTNDIFAAFDQGGIALFANGIPINEELTSKLSFWDAGTEVNQFPGVGADQAPRQTGPNTGTDEEIPVALTNDSFTYPSVSDAIKISISSR